MPPRPTSVTPSPTPPTRSHTRRDTKGQNPPPTLRLEGSWDHSSTHQVGRLHRQRSLEKAHLVEAGRSRQPLAVRASEQSSRTSPEAPSTPRQHRGPSTPQHSALLDFGACRPYTQPPNRLVPDLPWFIRGGWILQRVEAETKQNRVLQTTLSSALRAGQPREERLSAPPSIFLLHRWGSNLTADEP
jgi:hypothetical protein